MLKNTTGTGAFRDIPHGLQSGVAVKGDPEGPERNFSPE